MICVMNKTVMLLIAGLLFSANCPAATIIGSVPCAKWAKDRQEDGWSKVANTAWLTGYFAGIADSTGKNFLAGANIEDMEAAMDDYCHTHPQKSIYDGIWQKN